MERQDICQDVDISLWQKSILSVEEEYERQQEVLMVGDTCIGTLGNFSASIGKAKSKKNYSNKNLIKALLDGYGKAGMKLNYNKAVALATCLRN